MEEKTLDDAQCGIEEQQETKVSETVLSADGCRGCLVSQIRGTTAVKEVPK